MDDVTRRSALKVAGIGAAVFGGVATTAAGLDNAAAVGQLEGRAREGLAFEEVDKHIQAADLSQFQPGGKMHAGDAKGAAVVPNFCAAYKVVKPILQLIVNLPIIPKKWRDAVQAFITVADALCP
jgi:hypothetical protein